VVLCGKDETESTHPHSPPEQVPSNPSGAKNALGRRKEELRHIPPTNTSVRTLSSFREWSSHYSHTGSTIATSPREEIAEARYNTEIKASSGSFGVCHNCGEVYHFDGSGDWMTITKVVSNHQWTCPETARYVKCSMGTCANQI